MKQSIQNKIYWYLSDKVDLNLRSKGYRVTAQFFDVLLTYFLYIGSNWSHSTSPIKIELNCLKKDYRSYRRFKAHGSD